MMAMQTGDRKLCSYAVNLDKRVRVDPLYDRSPRESISLSSVTKSMISMARTAERPLFVDGKTAILV